MESEQAPQVTEMSPIAPVLIHPGLSREYVDGRRVKLGRYSFIIPPLALWEFKAALEDGRMDRIFEMRVPDETTGKLPGMTKEGLEALFSVLHASLLRNYPDLKIDVLYQYLDMANFLEVLDAVMSVNKIEVGRRPTLAVAPRTPILEGPSSGNEPKAL